MINRTFEKEHCMQIIDQTEEAAIKKIPVSRQLYFFVKLVMDIVSSIFLLILFFPVFILIASIIKLTSPGPVIFVQERIGKDRRIFRMYKFRTMVNDSHKMEDELAREIGGQIFFKIKKDPRVTPFGRFLRKFSLDEIPQIFNVLCNDMSLVGPRPLLLSDFKKFPRDQQLRRFAMKPGITGLWQVKGRNNLTDKERIELDCKYVDGWSILSRLRPISVPYYFCLANAAAFWGVLSIIQGLQVAMWEPRNGTEKMTVNSKST